MKDKIIKLQGKVQHYDWGGTDFVAQLFGIDNSEGKPFAEYWIGAHPNASALLETEEGWATWYDLIKKEPLRYLGEKVTEQFGELPYLLKVLDVQEMLSIQVHPDKEMATRGFEKEDAAGVPITAANRNYKDKNHKPEVMIALGDFWLLHGFKQEEGILRVLDTIPEFNFLKDLFIKQGYNGLYRFLMELPGEDADKVLLPLVSREISLEHSREQPGYWVAKYFKGALPGSNIDKGIFSIYFFNLVHLKAGEGIFQGAGVPHAYLEGQNVELMANSDNVLRGGLTTKHIDVSELLRSIKFEGIEPFILRGEMSTNGEFVYPLPIDDFGVSVINLENGREFVSKSKSPETYLVMQGEINCDDIIFKKGEVFVVLPDESYTIRGITNALLYKAYVPVKKK